MPVLKFHQETKDELRLFWKSTMRAFITMNDQYYSMWTYLKGAFNTNFYCFAEDEFSCVHVSTFTHHSSSSSTSMIIKGNT